MKNNLLKLPPHEWKIIKAKIVFLLLGIILFSIDRLCKIHYYSLYINNFNNYHHVVISNFLVFEIHLNSGIAFGWLNQTWLITIFLPLIILTIIFVAFLYSKNIFFAFCLSMVMCGGSSNLVDRIYDGHSPLFKGQVLDLFNLLNTPYVFNLADFYTTVGIILLTFGLIFGLFYGKHSFITK